MDTMSQGAAIVGSGWGCSVQIPSFRRAGINPVALVSRKGQAKARDFSVETSCDTMEELSKDAERTGKKYDVISIVTPPATHLPRSELALQCARVVLCEKPTALDGKQATSIAAAARRARESSDCPPGPLLLIDHELRFLPAIRLMRALVSSGYCGTVVDAWAEALRPARLGFGGGGGTVHGWHTWWSQASEGGGTLGAICSHQYDTLAYVMGLDGSGCKGKLTCSLRRSYDRRPVAKDAASIDTSRGTGTAAATASGDTSEGASASAGTGTETETAEEGVYRSAAVSADDAASVLVKILPRIRSGDPTTTAPAAAAEDGTVIRGRSSGE